MKACWHCGSGNELRSLFCIACGSRLQEADSSATGDAPPVEAPPATSVAEPVSRQGFVYGTPGGPLSVPIAMPPQAPPADSPYARGVASTPVSPISLPTPGSTCGSCGYPLPGNAVRWCPGCGRKLGGTATTTVTTGGPAGESAGSTAMAPPVEAAPGGWALVQVRAGEKLARFPLRTAHTVIGRSEGDLKFPSDPLLSPRHARIVFRSGGFWIEDLGSRNGIYFRLWTPTGLEDGDMINMGDLVFVYRTLPVSTPIPVAVAEPTARPFGSGTERARAALVRLLADGNDGPAFPLTPAKTIFGRKQGHFVFPSDPLLSREHAQFYEQDGRMVVEDLGSSNGTLLRIRRVRTLEKGTMLRMGDLCFEVSGPGE